MSDNSSSVTIGLRFADRTQVSPGLVQGIQLPFCEIDGSEHALNWDTYTRIDVTPGNHKIKTYTRFKGVPLKRFKGKTEITVGSGEHLTVTANLGQYKTKYETGTASP